MYNSAGSLVFGTKSETEIVLSGWIASTTQLYNTGSNGGIVLDASTKRIDVYSDPSTLRVRVGDVGTNQYGIKGFESDGTTTLFEISEVQNVIAGWDLKQEYIGKGQVSMSYADTAFLVNEGAFNRVLMGKIGGKFGTPASTYGFVLGDGTGHSSAGDVLVELTDNRNIIAGWTLSSGSFANAGGTAILGGVGYLSLGQSTVGYAQTGAWMEGTNSGRLSLVGTTGKML